MRVEVMLDRNEGMLGQLFSFSCAKRIDKAITFRL